MLSFCYREILFSLMIGLFSCSSQENSKYQEIRRHNEKGEFIYRKSDEYLYTLPVPERQKREKYPWEKNLVGNFPRISKEFFRCKGSPLNPVQMTFQDNGEPIRYFDCDGKHSLPIQNNKEFIFPILIDLLNYIQKKTGKRVVITSGYRCPKHNTYTDPSTYNKTSKHMIGAEVDFYVQGMENDPEKILSLLTDFYKQSPLYKGKKEYEEFTIYDGTTNVSTVPIRNKEIFIKLFNKEEGRDTDNRHPYPYIGVQVRYDRDLYERVFYTWNKAYNHYYRW